MEQYSEAIHTDVRDVLASTHTCRVQRLGGSIAGIRQLRNDNDDGFVSFALLKFYTLLNNVYFFVEYEIFFNNINWHMITHVLVISLYTHAQL